MFKIRIIRSQKLVPSLCPQSFTVDIVNRRRYTRDDVAVLCLLWILTSCTLFSISLPATGRRVWRGPPRHLQCAGTSSRCGTGTCRQVFPLRRPRQTPSGPTPDDSPPTPLRPPPALPLSSPWSPAPQVQSTHRATHVSANSGRQWFGLRPSVSGQDRSETKKKSPWSWSCTLWFCSWSCRSGVVLWNTVLSRSSSSWSWRIQQLFKYYLLYSVLGISLLRRSTVAFTYLKVKSVKCLCLLPVVLVLVLRIWSSLHHCSDDDATPRPATPRMGARCHWALSLKCHVVHVISKQKQRSVQLWLAARASLCTANVM